MKRPRVLFVSGHAILGGAELYLERLMGIPDAFTHAGLVAFEAGALLDRAAEHGYPTWCVPAPSRTSLPLAAVRLRRLLAEVRPDVVHANGVKAAAVVAVASAGLQIPTVWLKVDSSRDASFGRVAVAGVTTVVGISRHVLTPFQARWGAKLRLIYYSVDQPKTGHAEARTRLRRMFDADEHALVIALSGRRHPTKGHFDLLAALPNVRNAHPEMLVMMIGGEDPSDPGYGVALQNEIERQGWNSWVRLVDYRDDAAELVAGTDLVVVPSRIDRQSGWTEGFNLAGVEALAAGVPVVAYRHGALPETLAAGAVFVDEGDVVVLGQTIATLLADGRRRRDLGEAGRDLVAKRYAWSVASESWRRLYSELAGRAA